MGGDDYGAVLGGGGGGFAYYGFEALECFYAGLSCGHAAAHASGHPGSGGVDVAAYAVVVVAHF